MEEIWKDIEGYEGIYQVSNLGRIKTLPKIINSISGGSFRKEQIISPVIQKSGYAHIGLWKNSKCKQVRVHRIVAQHFCYNPDPIHKNQVNHLNENKLDNRACNLEWVTAKENTNYGSCIARRIYGREKAVECISINTGEVIKRFKSQAEANAWCGVARTDGHISACCKNKQKTAYGYRWRYASRG